MRILSCPICDVEGAKQLIEVWGEYRIYRCPQCRGEFSWPMKGFGREGYQEQYKEGLLWLKLCCPPDKFLRPSQMPLYHKTALNLVKSIPRLTRVMDVGCGTGTFLKLLSELGIEVYGLDIADEPILYAREKFGLKNVFVGTIEEIPQSWREFDLITAFEVLEHIEAPQRFMQRIYELLKPGGMIILSVPNNERLTVKVGRREEGDYPPNHLTRWVEETLRIFLTQMKFQEVTVRTLPLDRKGLIWLFSSLLKFRRRLLRRREEAKAGRGNERFISHALTKAFIGPIWTMGQIVGDIICLLARPFLRGHGHHLLAFARKPG